MKRKAKRKEKEYTKSIPEIKNQINNNILI